MSLPKIMEEYYQKVIQLQEQLRRSEEERLKLEIKFNEMLRMMKEEEEAHFKKLRSKYKQFLEEDKRRQQRNDKILEALDRIENRTVMWQAKAEKFKELRKRYQNYIKQKQTSGDSVQFLSNQRQNIYETNLDYKSSFSSMKSKGSKEPLSHPQYKEDSLQQNIEDTFSKNNCLNFGNSNSYYLRSSKDVIDLEKENLTEYNADAVPLKITKDLENSIKQSNKTPLQYSEHYPVYKHGKIENVSVLNRPPITKLLQQPSYASETSEEIHNNLELMLNQYKNETDINPLLTSKIQASANIQEQVKKPFLQNQFSELEYCNFNEDSLQNNLCESNNELSERNKTNKLENCQIGDEETKDKQQEKVTFRNIEQKRDSICSNTLNTSQNESNMQQLQLNETNTKFPENNFESVSAGNNDNILLKYNKEKSTKMFDLIEEQIQEVNNKDLKASNDTKLQDQLKQTTNLKQQNDETKYVTNEPNIQPMKENNANDQLQLNDNEQSKQYNNVSEEQLIFEKNGHLVERYDGNDRTSLQYNEKEQLDGEKGELLQSCNVNEQAYCKSDCSNGQYDENGQLIQQCNESSERLFNENSTPVRRFFKAPDVNEQICDGNGSAIQEYHESGQAFQEYDENGQSLRHDAIGQEYNSNVQLQEQYGDNGQLLQYDGNDQLLQYDEQPLHYYDNGPHLQYDSNGQPLQYDDNGEPPQYDENEQMLQYNGNVQPLQYDANGQLLQYVSNEQPLLQYDENGQPLQYDGNGQPLQYDDNIGQQYDANVQPLQYDANGQPLQYVSNEQPLQYDENGQQLQCYDNGDVVSQYYDENGQSLRYYNEIDNFENERLHNETQDPIQEQQVKTETKSHVFELLDTDTESIKHDTKISNDSDFDIGNCN